MTGEEYSARKYCEPKPYWQCLQGLSGGNHYKFDELNRPEYWLDAVADYTQDGPSDAAKQLHRLVEIARSEFKAKQDRIYASRKVSETEGLEDIWRREDKAWDTFNAQKREYLQAYLKAIQTGKIERQRAKRRHRCQGEGCKELLSGRGRFCDICKRARHRKAARVYRRRNQPHSVISFTREISRRNRAFGYPDTPKHSTAIRTSRVRGKGNGFWQEIGKIELTSPIMGELHKRGSRNAMAQDNQRESIATRTGLRGER